MRSNNMKLVKTGYLCLRLAVAASVITGLSGCAVGKFTDSASAKNLGMDGYVMYGAIETIDSASSAPTGKLIIGRVTYKSRKVGISADQKVPNTGFFKMTKTKSLFGTEEQIVEYDWTAGSDADALAAEKKLQEMKEKAETDTKSVSQ